MLNLLWRMQTILGRPVCANELAVALDISLPSASGRLRAVSDSLKSAPEFCNYKLDLTPRIGKAPATCVLLLRPGQTNNKLYQADIWADLQSIGDIDVSDNTKIIIDN